VRLDPRWIVASIGIAIVLVLSSELLLTLLRAAGSDDPTASSPISSRRCRRPGSPQPRARRGAGAARRGDILSRPALRLDRGLGRNRDRRGGERGVLRRLARLGQRRIRRGHLLLGIALAWLYRAAGSLWASVIAHGVNNAAAFVLLWVGEMRKPAVPWSCRGGAG